MQNGNSQVRFVYKHFPVVDRGAANGESTQAAEASECANAQGKFWPYHDALFALAKDASGQPLENRGTFTASRLKELAGQLGLDTNAFAQCFDSHKFASVVRADQSDGRSRGVNQTPTVFVNGQKLDNPLDWNEVQQAIEAGLKR